MASEARMTGFDLLKAGVLETSGFTAVGFDTLRRAFAKIAFVRFPEDSHIALAYLALAGYEIRAQLVGPSGRALGVRTIWMTEYLSGATKFITLIPDKES